MDILKVKVNGEWVSIPAIVGPEGKVALNKLIADYYDNSETYAVGDFCIYNNTLYKCSTKINVAEDFTIGHWTKVLLVDEIDQKVSDVQINGTSILNNGVANIPKATTNTLGAVAIGDRLSINENGQLQVRYGSDSAIRYGISDFLTIPISKLHVATFYSLSKAAGVDLGNGDVTNITLGTYPDNSKAAIQNMLGISSLIATDETGYTASKAYSIGDVFTMGGIMYRTTSAIAQGDTITPDTNCVAITIGEDFAKKIDIPVTDVQVNGASILSNGVANVPQGSGTARGVFMLARDAEIKEGVSTARVLTPGGQHTSTFYGLAKAAGDSTQSASSNAVGTYTAEAKTAIKTMLGVIDPTVSDVQVNGTSILSNGVANIPIASSDDGVFGIVKPMASMGTAVASNGGLAIVKPNNTQIKTGADEYRPIVPQNQHVSTFYGLAKAAGDTTMSLSSNTVGTYTSEAKVAIKNMLGVTDSALDVNVTGTDPAITAQANTRYICGEVSTVSFTPSSTGICELLFTSGSTVAILTLPSTVKMPEWFDISSLETNTVYNISIIDGVYGAVMTWAL